MAAMFTMMNNARLSVGLEGLALAERSYQAALAYARERVQGRRRNGGADRPAAIIEHPDVRRMLVTMKAQVEAMRALAYTAAAALDRAQREPDPARRPAAEGRLHLLIPLVKAWCTDLGFEIASSALQVHGGMGYIEETGIAQHLRDARIAMIYEGTNGIQAQDLVGRKLRMADGAPARRAVRRAPGRPRDAARCRSRRPRAAAGGGARERRARSPAGCRPTTATIPMPAPPAPRPICACWRPRSAASCSPARRSPPAAARRPRPSSPARSSTSSQLLPPAVALRAAVTAGSAPLRAALA